MTKQNICNSHDNYGICISKVSNYVQNLARMTTTFYTKMHAATRSPGSLCAVGTRPNMIHPREINRKYTPHNVHRYDPTEHSTM